MKRKMKTEKQKLIQENDKIWSLLVRLRDNFTCKMCGKQTKQVEAAHIFGRANKPTRWLTENGVSLCYYCHRFRIHGGAMSPDELKDFWISRIGKDRYNLLEEKSKEKVRFDINFVRVWNYLLRAEFLNETGMPYEEFLKKIKMNKEV